MYRYLSCLLLLPGLLLASFSSYGVKGKWQNSEVKAPLSVQTRFEFPAEFLTGALVIQRYPPLCRNAELAFEAGPAAFAQQLLDQPVVIRFKVDDFPAREALFSSHQQQRSEGPFLVLKMVAMERASTLLAEIAVGIKLNVVFEPENPIYMMDIELNGSSSALESAVLACTEQAAEIETEAYQLNRPERKS